MSRPSSPPPPRRPNESPDAYVARLRSDIGVSGAQVAKATRNHLASSWMDD